MATKVRCPYNGRHWTNKYTDHIGWRDCGRTAYCDKCDKAFYETWSTSTDVNGFVSLYISWYELGKDWYINYMNDTEAKPHQIIEWVGKVIKKRVQDCD